MPTHRFLTYFASDSAEGGVDDLAQVVNQSVEGADLDSELVTEDLSSIQGEPCLAVELTAEVEQIDQIRDGWVEAGLRVVDADEEVRELEPRPEDEE